MTQKYIGWGLIGVLLITTIIFFNLYKSEKKESSDLSGQLSYVMDMSCRDLQEEKLQVKEDHRLLLEDVKDLYHERAAAQFNAEWGTGELKDVTNVFVKIQDKESILSGLEMKSREIGQKLANCDPTK